MKTLSRFRSGRLAAATLLLAACLDPSAVRGELGKGIFQYTCDSSTRSCSNGVATQFPDRIALDTRFDLSFETNGGMATTGTLQPASTQLLEIRDSSWRAVSAGEVGILNVLGDGSLYDYTFVTIEPATSVRFFLERPNDPFATGTWTLTDQESWDPLGAHVNLKGGESVKLIAEGQAADGAALAGESLLDFSCEDPGVAALVRPTRRPARFELGAVGPGTTTCTIQALGFSDHFEVTVSGHAEEPDPDPKPDSGTEPDGGSDGDASTDGGVQRDGEAQ